jgi:hypothetical protein
MSRGSEADASWSRFVLGVWLVVIGALIYPVYSYKVVTYLMARDAEAVMQPFVSEMNASNRQIAAQQAQWVADNEAQNARNEAQNNANRIQSVQIKGASMVSGHPLVIAEFGSATATEIVDRVCDQASAWFRRDMGGQSIRLQRYRGEQPALDAGTITCP